MYNKEVKKQFIAEVCENANEAAASKTLFKKCEALENNVGLDLYDIENTIIAQYILDNSNNVSFETANIYYNRCLRYKKWALKKNYISEIGKFFVFQDANLRGLYDEYISESIIRSPEELLETMHELKEHRMEKQSHGTCAADLALAVGALVYSGIKYSDVFKLSVNDIIVSKNNIVIATPDKIVELYDEFYDVVNWVKTQREFYAINNPTQTYAMSDRFIDDGKNREEENMRHIIVLAIRRTIGKKQTSFANIYVMGRVYHYKKYFEDENKSRKDFMDWFENDMYNKPKGTAKRRSVYAIYDNWDIVSKKQQ